MQTAHTMVTAATGREVLYVAATRGRDANTQYVDTRYDPDPDTAHASAEEQTAADVLRHVLATPVADTSATDTIAASWSERHHIARIWAEYATIAAAAHHDRYDALVATSGLAPDHLAQARASTAYERLLADLRHAEARGLDVNRAFPRLVTGRTLQSVDDVAAVLHRRVERWARAADPHDTLTEPRIAGLFPSAVHVHDLDLERGLSERQELLEGRVRELAVHAIERHLEWTRPFGTPPGQPQARAVWLHRLATVAAYRERWIIISQNPLGADKPTSNEQRSQRDLAQTAMDRARAAGPPTPNAVGGGFHTMDRDLGRKGVEL